MFGSLEFGILNYIENKPPLPWRERVGVRGEDEMLTPTRTLPHQGGGEVLLFSWLEGDEPDIKNLSGICLPAGRQGIWLLEFTIALP